MSTSAREYAESFLSAMAQSGPDLLRSVNAMTEEQQLDLLEHHMLGHEVLANGNHVDLVRTWSPEARRAMAVQVSDEIGRLQDEVKKDLGL